MLAQKGFGCKIWLHLYLYNASRLDSNNVTVSQFGFSENRSHRTTKLWGLGKSAEFSRGERTTWEVFVWISW